MRRPFYIIFNSVRIVFLAGTVLLLDSCLQPHARTDLDTTSSGTINISADETFKPIIDSEIKVFESNYPNAKIIVHYKPEAACLRDLIKDSSTRLVIVTRGLTKEEEAYFKDSIKFAPPYGLLANDAIAVVVNNQSADSFITMNKIRALLEGTTADNEKIVFDGSSATSTVRYAVDSILRGKPLNGDKVIAVDSSLAVIDYVETHKDAIGLVGVSWLGDKNDTTQTSFVKKVRIASVQCSICDDDNIFVKPYQANIAQNRYPMVRGLYYILKENYDGLGNGFVNFMSQEKGQLIFWHAYLWPTRNLMFREAAIQ